MISFVLFCYLKKKINVSSYLRSSVKMASNEFIVEYGYKYRRKIWTFVTNHGQEITIDAHFGMNVGTNTEEKKVFVTKYSILF